MIPVLLTLLAAAGEPEISDKLNVPGLDGANAVQSRHWIDA